MLADLFNSILSQAQRSSTEINVAPSPALKKIFVKTSAGEVNAYDVLDESEWTLQSVAGIQSLIVSNASTPFTLYVGQDEVTVVTLQGAFDYVCGKLCCGWTDMYAQLEVFASEPQTFGIEELIGWIRRYRSCVQNYKELLATFGKVAWQNEKTQTAELKPSAANYGSAVSQSLSSEAGDVADAKMLVKFTPYCKGASLWNQYELTVYIDPIPRSEQLAIYVDPADFETLQDKINSDLYLHVHNTCARRPGEGEEGQRVDVVHSAFSQRNPLREE